jgi:hypothetical protein
MALAISSCTCNVRGTALKVRGSGGFILFDLRAAPQRACPGNFEQRRGSMDARVEPAHDE